MVDQAPVIFQRFSSVAIISSFKIEHGRGQFGKLLGGKTVGTGNDRDGLLAIGNIDKFRGRSDGDHGVLAELILHLRHGELGIRADAVDHNHLYIGPGDAQFDQIVHQQPGMGLRIGHRFGHT